MGIIASLAFAQSAIGQVQYFVYLQTENNRPFFVQFNKKNISSSGIGHLIMPQLPAGTYDIVVGFAGENTRQEYQITLKDRDLGFLIKGFDGGTRFGLLNLQTAEVQLSGAAKEAVLAAQKKQEEELAAEKRRQDEAAKTAEQQKQAEAAQKQIEADALAEANRKREEAAQKAMNEKNTATPPPAAPPAATDADPKAAELKRKQEEEIKRYNAERLAALKKQEQEAEAKKTGEKAPESTNTGEKVLTAAEILRLQEEARRIDARGKRDSALNAATTPGTNKTGQPKFLDIDFTMPDSSNKTIPLVPLVPANAVPMPLADSTIITQYSADSAKVEIPVGGKTDSAKAQPIEVTQTAFTPQETKPVDSTIAKPAEPVPPARVDTLANQPIAVKTAVDSALATPIAGSNCMAEASNSDIDLMLMLIKAEKDPEYALDLVKKMVRLKCISTGQVRKLAGQFATDEARYQLLDMCYKYTIDRKQYSVLVNLLTDAYYINRFKALVQ
ncbi:MAG: DUF4476 domain-containing protein [Chitinophagaceae bacterium]|nr:DUF4476 domain-containing protein [Chitinophagaceae bacterium]